MGVSTTSVWPQIDERVTLMPGSHQQQHQHHIADRRNNNLHLHGVTAAAAGANFAAATAAGRAMENQQALKCPRCDSSNTKFCYYNNYSLSQPRHFCKACKRYWTRGGTLRNVPVGGGCRKNKRIKKNSSTSSTAAAPSAVADPPSLPRHISDLSLPQSSSTSIDPILYSLHNASADLNFPSLLKRLEQRNVVSNSLSSYTDEYDFNPHLSSLGLCFPMNTTTAVTHQQDYRGLQFPTPDSAATLAAAASTASSSTSLVHDYSLLGSSLSSSTAASLLAASLGQQQKTGVLNPSGWPATTYVDIQAGVGGLGGLFKEIKEEDGSSNGMSHNSRLEWQIPCDNQLETIDGTSLYNWSANVAAGVGGGWPEAPTNCGSSVTPLI